MFGQAIMTRIEPYLWRTGKTMLIWGTPTGLELRIICIIDSLDDYNHLVFTPNIVNGVKCVLCIVYNANAFLLEHSDSRHMYS